MTQNFNNFEADMAARKIAVMAAGWQGSAARALMLRSNTPAEFASHLAEANTLREIAAMVKPELSGMGIDVDLAVERSIIHSIPLADVRAIIVQRLAERDEATHTDTTPYRAQISSGDVYAQRREAQHARR
jgi:hypothetical protein